MDEESFAFGSFRLVPAQRTLFEDGKPLRLGSRALDILVALVESAGETIHKDRLIARTWPDTVVDEGALRVHVAALPKALGDGRAGKRYIANVPGRGYSFVAPVLRERGQPASSPPDGAAATNNLPVPLTRIVGRDEIIAVLKTQLSQRRFLTIVGPGGIGKTTVATAVARTLSASYRHGLWFVALSSLADPDLVPSALTAVLGISLSGVNPASGVTAWLRDKQALIVLDSCEPVVGAAASFAEAVLKAAPRVHILATSREPLRGEGEWLHRLSSLEVPPTDLTTEDALKYPAVELFSERASGVAEGFSFGAADLPAVIETCRKLDGVALALELAAAQVDVLGIKGLAARLDDRFAVLTKGRRTALPRHQTLRAAMDWSYDLLPETEQLIIKRLAVFRGDFTMDAAVAVVADDRIKTTDVLEGVANLATRSLVATDIGRELAFHRLLDTTRAYAFEKLGESGERERLARRHAEYYWGLFEQAEIELETRPTTEWLADYGPRIDNLRAALDWAFSPDGDASIGVALTAAAVPLWMHLSLLEECRGRVERALGALDAGASRDVRQEMKLCAALGGSLLFTKGSMVEIEVAWTRALTIAEGLADPEYQLRALWGLWVHRMHNGGDYGIGLGFAQRFRGLALAQGDPTDRAIADRMIGVSLHYRGDQPDARRYIEHMLAHYVAPVRRSPSARFVYDQKAIALVALARILWVQGFPDRAWSITQGNVEDALALNNPLSLFLTLTEAACPIAFSIGDLVAAERYAVMLLDRSAAHELAVWQSWAHRFQGTLLIRNGDLERGLAAVAHLP